jgi:hypothetical protein
MRSSPRRRSGGALARGTAAADHAPTAARKQVAVQGSASRPFRLGRTFPGDLPYGHDYTDTYQWADRDGRVYATDSPLILRLRRAVDRVTRRRTA